MPYIANELLDLLPHVGQVASSVEFELVTEGVSLPIGRLHPASDERMSIQNQTTGNIKRTLRGFYLNAEEAVDINLFRDRIKPFFVLEDGTRWPMGEFLFASEDRTETTAGRPLATTLFDQTSILGNPRPNAFGLDTGEAIVFWIDRMAEESGIATARRRTVGNNDIVVNDPVSWPSGTPRMRIMNELAELAGYLTPYFDNNGILIIRPNPEVRAGPDSMPYDERSPRIFVDSLTRAPNLLDSPNRFIAINSGSQQAEIVGVFDVPDHYPQSIKNRGYEVPKIIRTQGLDSTESAARLAHVAANQDPSNYEVVQFDSPPDPRHDTFEIVVLNGGEVYIEIDWTMDLEPGGTMRHNLRRSLDTAGGNQ